MLTEFIAVGAVLQIGPKTNSAHVRYRHPEYPAISWSGHGRKPQWIVAWLAQGKEMWELEAQQQKEAA